MGGSVGRAPTPPDLFVVSLGACVAAFVAHYCEQEGIDTRDLSVETAFEKTEKPAYLTNFSVDVRLPYWNLWETARPQSNGSRTIASSMRRFIT